MKEKSNLIKPEPRNVIRATFQKLKAMPPGPEKVKAVEDLRKSFLKRP